MEPRSLSLKIPRRGLWSVTIVSLGQPRTKRRARCKVQQTARASPSVGAYRLSAVLVNREPAKTSFQPSAQQLGILEIGQEQCFWRSKKPIPTLLQSH